jgi:pyruvate,water dikinase
MKKFFKCGVVFSFLFIISQNLKPSLNILKFPNSNLRRIKAIDEITLPSDKRIADAIKYLQSFGIPEWHDFIKKISEANIKIVGPETGMFDLLRQNPDGYYIEDGNVYISQRLLEDTFDEDQKDLRMVLFARLGILLNGESLAKARSIEKQIVGKSILSPQQSQLDDFIKLNKALIDGESLDKDLRRIVAYRLLLRYPDLSVSEYMHALSVKFGTSIGTSTASSDLRELAAKYPNIFEVFTPKGEQINRYRVKPNEKPKPILRKKLYVPFIQLSLRDTPLVGGKSANNGEQYNQHKEPEEILGEESTPIPIGYSLTTKAFRIFLDANPEIRDFIRETMESINFKDHRAVRDASSHIREAIMKGKMPQEIKDVIEEIYSAIAKEMGEENPPVAVRSSAAVEDLPGAAFYGQFETIIGTRGVDAVIGMVLSNWASLFNANALIYGYEMGIDPMDFDMGVAIQYNIDSKIAGTGFGLATTTGAKPRPSGTINDIMGKVVDVNIPQNFKFICVINAVRGQGAVQVGTEEQDPRLKGDVDEYMVGETNDGRWLVLRKEIGSKKVKMVLNPAGGTTLVDLTDEEYNNFVMTDEQIIDTAKRIKVQNEYYGQAMDVEFAIDQNDKFWNTQARPETKYSKQAFDLVDLLKTRLTKEVVDKIQSGELKPILEGMRIGFTGAGYGKFVIIDRDSPIPIEEQLDKVKEGDILVSQDTDPRYTDAMIRAGIVIVETQNKNAHAAGVAKDFGVITILGARNAVEVLKQYEGEVGTVDAERAMIFLKKLAIEKIDKSYHVLELVEKYPTLMKTGIITFDPQAFERDSALVLDPMFKIGLDRIELTLQKEIGIHPLDIIAYDQGQLGNETIEVNGKEVLLKDYIKDKIRGYKSASDFYRDKIRMHLLHNLFLIGDEKTITARTNDLTPDKYGDMNPKRIPVIYNPMIDIRGLAMELDENPDKYGNTFKQAFKLELEAFIDAWEVFPDRLEIMFPVVRDPQELKKAIELIDEVIEEKGLSGRPVIYSMNETGVMSLFVNQFTKVKLDDGETVTVNQSTGQNDLFFSVFKWDRRSQRIPANAFGINERHIAFLRVMAITAKLVKELGGKMGSCGNIFTFDPEFFAKFFASLQLDSASVISSETYPEAKKYIYEAEQYIQDHGIPEDLKDIVNYRYPSRRDANPEEESYKVISENDLIRGIGVHPKAMSVKEYGDKIYESVSAKLQTLPKGEKVAYRTNDMRTNEYMALKDGQQFEPIGQEETPLFGFYGLIRNLDEEEGYLPYTEAAYRAVLKAAKDAGRKIIIEFDGTRADLDLKAGIEVLDKVASNLGMKKGEDFDTGVVLSTLADVACLDKIIELGVSSVTWDEEELLQSVLLANINRVPIREEWKEKIVERLVNIIKTYVEDYQEKGYSVYLGNPS